MKRLFLFCIVFSILIVPYPICAQNAVIAAWNLGGFEPIPSLRVTNQVRAIRNINPDLMILTEVNPNSVATDIAQQLNNYKAIILEQPAQQNIAILYKNTTCVVDARLIPGSGDDNERLRKALAAHVQIGKFDFVLIGVHMKSGRQTNGADNPVPVRNRQARAIAQYLAKAMAAGERDVLVIGDYNMIPNVDTATFAILSPGPTNNESLLFLSDNFAGQVSHIGSCQNGQPRGNLLDGFAISRTFTGEYIQNSIRLIPFSDTSIFTGATNTPYTCENYRGLVSDHFPFVARFRTNLSDDD